jgi:hypothetical protein
VEPISDFIAGFLADIAKYDIHPKEIIPDGRLHLFGVNGDRGKAGWYALNVDGILSGVCSPGARPTIV